MYLGNVGHFGNLLCPVACFVFGLLPRLILLHPILYFVFVVQGTADLVERDEASFPDSSMLFESRT